MNSRLRTFLIFFVLLGTLQLANITCVQAQTEPLTFGSTVGGLIEGPDVTYTFKGAADDIIIATIKKDYASTNNGLVPGLRIRQGDSTFASTYDHFVVGSATLVVVLPASGTYTLVATGKNSTEATTGAFILTLSKAQKLSAGQAVKATFKSNGPGQYYALISDTAYTVSYKRLTTALKLELGVNTIKGNGQLEAVGKIEGAEAVGGTIIIQPSEPTIYVLTISEALFSFNLDKVQADYTILYDQVS